jgi:membrane protein
MSPRAISLLLKETLFAWHADRGPRLGAALAYYTLFSLAPLLIIVMAIAAMAFGQEAAQAQIVRQIEEVMGLEGVKAIQTLLENTSKPSSGVMATLIGLATIIFGATIVFTELQDALNMIWKIQPKPERSMVLGLMRDRFMSFAMVFAMGFLLLLSIVANAVLEAIVQIFGEILSNQVYVLRAVNFMFLFAIVTLLCAMIYKVLPDTYIAWGDVIIGAVVTSLLFAFGKYLIGLYIVHSSVVSAYGAAGSLVAVLVWMYYSAQIFYFGAEFTKVYATRKGHRAAPRQESAPNTQESYVGEGVKYPSRPAR